jgi:predicted acylesterase/phospholipase RssA
MGVLLGLEQEKSPTGNCLQEVDYISTVSGGSFAGGAYLAARYEHDRLGGVEPFSLQQHFDTTIQAVLRRSYILPVARAWINPVTWISHLDDGDGLERSIDHHLLRYRNRRKELGRKEARSMVLGDCFVPADSQHLPVKHPMLVSNSTIFSNMAIFPFAPDVLDTFQISGYAHNMKHYRSKQPVDPYSVPLAVGIKASGSFPGAIANSTLESSYDSVYRYLHLIDGGVADNVGFRTALEVLAQDTVAKKKVLLVVDADGMGRVRTFDKRKSGVLWLRVLFRLPTSGLDSRRIMRKQEITRLCHQFDIEPIFLSFTTLLENNESPPPTGIRRNFARKWLMPRLREKPEALTDWELQLLYDLVSAVKTKYSIKKKEQDLLVRAGRKVVQLQHLSLKAVMNPQKVLLPAAD